MQEDIIYIADPRILAIPVVECHEPMVDIKDSNDICYGPPPECALTADCYTKMRKSVYEKLIAAQKTLPDGLKFRIYEAYRSLEVQQLLFDQRFSIVDKNCPHWSYEEKFRETTRLVSPVVNLDKSINIPPHNTGAAVDIELITATGELLDMGMSAKDWIDIGNDLCRANCKTISREAQQNRQLLLDTMAKQGFVNYPNEWWHFSFGDRYWAYYQPKKQAIYDSIK